MCHGHIKDCRIVKQIRFNSSIMVGTFFVFCLSMRITKQGMTKNIPSSGGSGLLFHLEKISFCTLNHKYTTSVAKEHWRLLIQLIEHLLEKDDHIACVLPIFTVLCWVHFVASLKQG